MTPSSVRSRTGRNLIKARQGNREAFSALAEPYRREIIAYCYRLTGKLTEAEDLAQEVLVRAFKAMETFEARASTRAWLYRIAHNLCINHVQRSQPDWDSLDEVDSENRIAPVPTAEEEGQDRENVRLGFVALLESLPPRQRAALVLRDVLGWSADETARILEMTVPAVKNALARARKSLAQGPYDGDPANVHDFAAADPAARALVADWVDAFEKGNTARMVALLTEYDAPAASNNTARRGIRKDPSPQSSPTSEWGEEAGDPGATPVALERSVLSGPPLRSGPGNRQIACDLNCDLGTRDSGIIVRGGLTLLSEHSIDDNTVSGIRKDPSPQSSPASEWGEEAGGTNTLGHIGFLTTINHQISSPLFSGERRSEDVHAE